MSDAGSHRKRRFSEAAHKLNPEQPAERDDNGRQTKGPASKRSYNMAAHKLSYRSPPSADVDEQESGAPGSHLDALANSNRDTIAHAGKVALGLGALGVVYGDLGTSPLYTEQVIFGSYRATAHVTPATAYGVASLIFWALMIIVSIKYAGFIMRAHNRGDGGIMALTSLLQRNKVAHATVLVTPGNLRRGAVLR